MPLTTTLNEIRKHSPCEDGYKKLLAHLGKTKGDDDAFPILTVLDSNGMDDALWVVDHVVNPYICRLFAADCAESVLHIFEKERPGDNRPRDAISVARDPNATAAAWAAAGDAARAAAAVAGAAARAAARDAAWAAAWAAAWDAARDAAWAAARDAAWAAARDAAGDAAWDSMTNRLRQYLEHGEAAKDMPWSGKEKTC